MSKSKKATIRKEVKKEVKAIKKAARKAPKASRSLRKEVRAAVRPVVRGTGGYFGDLGGKIGNVVDMGASLVKTISGLGDYKVKSNSLVETGRPPQVKNTKFSSTITGHPEYICDIKSSVNFSIQKFSVNPGIARTFPWLAPQTNGYEQYKPKGILFQYRPTCGDAIASTNNAMGVVLLGSEYNVNLPDFANKMEMEDHEYTTSIKPDECAMHPIECARSKTVLDDLYVRTGTENVPDLKFYDMCNFYVATQGQQTDGVTIGELWVTYEFEFLKPTLSSRTTTNVAQHWYWDQNLGSAPDGTYFFRNLREHGSGTTTSAIATTLGPFPPGKYICILSIILSSGTPSVSGSLSFQTTGTFGGVFPFTDTLPATGVETSSQQQLIGNAGSIWVDNFCMNSDGETTINACPTVGSNVMFWDLWVCPVGSAITSRRRAVDYDPMAVMKRKLDELNDRLQRAEAKALAPPRWVDDEECKSPCSTPIHVEEPIPPELTRSQANIALTLLDRLNIGMTSKTGSHVRAA